MFSDVGRSLDQDTIEYTWLLEIQLGKLCGKLTSPQLHSVLACLETMALLLGDSENELNSPADDALLRGPQVTQKATSPQQNFFPLQQFLQPKTSNTSNLNKNISGGNLGGSQRSSEKNIRNERKHSEVGKEKEIGAGTTTAATTTTSTTTTTASNINTSEDDALNADTHKLKYKVCRLAIDAVDFWLVEAGVALQLWVSPIRLATCNLHGKQVCYK